MWNLKTTTITIATKFIDTENRLAVARGRGLGVGEMGEGSQKV